MVTRSQPLGLGGAAQWPNEQSPQATRAPACVMPRLTRPPGEACTALHWLAPPPGTASSPKSSSVPLYRPQHTAEKFAATPQECASPTDTLRHASPAGGGPEGTLPKQLSVPLSRTPQLPKCPALAALHLSAALPGTSTCW